MDFTSLRYEVDGRVARITLDRPDRLNAIDGAMPGEIQAAVEVAGDDDRVHVIVLAGAGRAFCAGYDLKRYAEGRSAAREAPATSGSAGEAEGRVAPLHNAIQEQMPWDPTRDLRGMKANTDAFMSLWRSPKPTIAKVHGYAVAGGSDIALCCDLVVMADDAKIGYPPARVWGIPTTAMWVYRVGAERAKRLLFTGDLLDGRTAARWGLVSSSVPADRLDDEVEALADRIAGVPRNQLHMAKLMVNQAYENMGMASTQLLATLFDGIARHTPEGFWFKREAERHGFHSAVEWRDSGRPIPDGDEARDLLDQP